MNKTQIEAARKMNQKILATDAGMGLLRWLNETNDALSKASRRGSHEEIQTIAAKRRSIVAAMENLGWTF